MNEARDEILAKIRAVAGERPGAELPDAWHSRQVFSDLAGQFEKALSASGGQVIRASGWDAALAALERVLEEVGARRIVVTAEPFLVDVSWQSRFPGKQWHLVGINEGDLKAYCATADVGVSSAVVALAETGSVIITSGAYTGRLATLLPPVHVVLLPVSRVTSDLFTWAKEMDQRLPANLVFVSGPSKTADIEQTLAVGVHGPGRFVVILFSDAS